MLAGFLGLFVLLNSVFAPKPKTETDIHYECTIRRGLWSPDKNVCIYFSYPLDTVSSEPSKQQ